VTRKLAAGFAGYTSISGREANEIVRRQTRGTETFSLAFSFPCTLAARKPRYLASASYAYRERGAQRNELIKNTNKRDRAPGSAAMRHASRVMRIIRGG
jgi:hypothetical protein